MVSFLAAVFSIKFLVENWRTILLVFLILVAVIVTISKKRKEKRAAYLALPVLFYGNKSTQTYHRCDCVKLNGANPLNLVAFRHPDEVRRYGYKPCQICKP